MAFPWSLPWSVVDLEDGLAARHVLPDLDSDLADRAVFVRGQRLLHLHGLEHDDGVTRGHPLALLSDDLHDGALHRADQRGIPAARGPPAAPPRRSPSLHRADPRRLPAGPAAAPPRAAFRSPRQ